MPKYFNYGLHCREWEGLITAASPCKEVLRGTHRVEGKRSKASPAEDCRHGGGLEV